MNKESVASRSLRSSESVVGGIARGEGGGGGERG